MMDMEKFNRQFALIVAGMIALAVALTSGILWLDRFFFAPPTEQTVQRDTIIIRDTIRPAIPASQVAIVVRYDTIRPQGKPAESETPKLAAVPLPRDTIPQMTPGNDVVIPITRNTYQTEDYTAVIEGYKPKLVSMELYRKTREITNTVTKTKAPRWALTAGPGLGYGPGGVQPNIGVTLGFVLWSK